MDRDERRRLTKEVALEVLYRFFKFVSGSEFLHFGLFESDIPADFQHLRQAQERYLDRLIEIIPPATRTILDVGAGSGRTAEVLIGRGFDVDCVAPGKMLADIAEKRLEGLATVYRGPFEEVAIARRYDLVLFSESFQYIEIDVAIPRALSLLNAGGHILICDFFRRKVSIMGGGHIYRKWEMFLKSAPLELLYERDITRETSHTVDIINAFNQEVGRPFAEGALFVADTRWPFLSRIAWLFFRRDIDRLFSSQFSNRTDGESFRRDKLYKTYLFRQKAA